MMIRGPASIALFTHEEKKILILGDLHGTIPECDGYDVIDWIQDIVTNTDQCIDLFVEDNYQSPDSKQPSYYDSYLARVIMKLRYWKRDNLRYHYTDLRSYVDSRGTIYAGIHFTRPLANELRYNKSIRIDMSEHMNNIHNILEYLLGYKNISPIHILAMWDHVSMTVLNKTIFTNGVRIGYHVDLNSGTLLEHLEFYLLKIGKKRAKSDNINRIDESFIRTFYRHLNRRIGRADTHSMDGEKTFSLLQHIMGVLIHYPLVLRIFGGYSSRFHTNECSDYPKNIITYTGVNHSVFLIDFISDYYGITPELYITDASQCIELDREIIFP